MKQFYSVLAGFLMAPLVGCENSAVAQSGALDRTSLPIQPPVATPVTELDARNVTPPPTLLRHPRAPPMWSSY